MKKIKNILLLVVFGLLQNTDLFAQANRPGSGNCLNFNRLDIDYVQINNNPTLNFGNGSFTVEVWFKLKQIITGSGQNHVLIAKGRPANTSTAGYMLRFHWEPRGFSAIYSDASGVGGIYADASSNYDDGNWHHAAAVFDKAGSGNTFLYVDGLLVATADISGEGSPDNTSNLAFGVAPPTEDPIHSLIDEIRIWDYARTQTQIRDNMTKKLIGTETGLVGYWRLDESSGTTVFDSSPNNNDGTLF